VPSHTGDRSQHFPAIEKKHGKPVAHWFDLLSALGEAKYDEQMALLMATHGFSRAHANAVVMTHRGSPSSRRHDGPDAWFAALDAAKQTKAREIFTAVTERYPDLEMVVAWNQPMLKLGKNYVFGMSAATKHFTINPMSKTALDAMRDRLDNYKVGKNTFNVPADWDVDADLLQELVGVRLTEVET
jgi:uncharacterized protein